MTLLTWQICSDSQRARVGFKLRRGHSGLQCWRPSQPFPPLGLGRLSRAVPQAVRQACLRRGRLEGATLSQLASSTSLPSTHLGDLQAHAPCSERQERAANGWGWVWQGRSGPLAPPLCCLPGKLGCFPDRFGSKNVDPGEAWLDDRRLVLQAHRLLLFPL